MDRAKEDSAAETAGFWDARLRAPGCSSADRREFEQWRDANPAHRAAFEQLQSIITALRNERSRPELRAIRDNALAIAERRQRRLSVAIAAGVLGLISAGLIWMLGPRWIERGETMQEVYSTGTGQRSTVTLQDGSTLELNSKTQIKVAFNKAERAVSLMEGQAIFKVAKNSRQPFVVYAAGREIRALGTSFDVRLEKSSLRVTLLEGKVAVTQAAEPQSDGVSHEPVVLAPGEQFVAESPRKSKPDRERTNTKVVRNIDVAKVTDWRNGRVFLEDLALGDAVAEMNKYSAVQISVTDPSLESLRVNGMFRAGEQQAFVSALQSYFRIVAEPREDGQILLKPRF